MPQYHKKYAVFVADKFGQYDIIQKKRNDKTHNVLLCTKHKNNG